LKGVLDIRVTRGDARDMLAQTRLLPVKIIDRALQMGAQLLRDEWFERLAWSMTELSFFLCWDRMR